MKKRRRARRDYKTLIATFEQSGLSLNAFAKREGVPYSTLAQWRRRLAKGRKPSTTRSKTRFLPVRLEATPVALPAVQASASWCEVRLRSGHQLRVPAGFDPATLGALVQALEPAACSR